MKYVIKRSGKRQKYILGKIEKALDRAAKNAGMSASRRKRLIHNVAHNLDKNIKKSVIKTKELRGKILRRLNTHAKAVAAAWKTYDKERKKR